MTSVTEQGEGYVVLDDFLSVGDPEELKTFHDIQGLVISDKISYRLYDSQYGDFDRDKYISPKQFCHHLYIHDGHNEHISPFFEKFVPVFLKLKEYFGGYQLLRAKINILSIDLSGKSQVPHVDLRLENEGKYAGPAPHWVFLYYLNDSDGDTLFFDENGNITKRIAPKENRAVLFDGTTLHAATNPAKTSLRTVLNVDVLPDELLI